MIKKTRRQWLMELPPGVREKAIANAEASESASLLDDPLSNSPTSTLMCAFNWSRTPEGGDYWMEQHQKLCAREAGHG